MFINFNLRGNISSFVLGNFLSFLQYPFPPYTLLLFLLPPSPPNSVFLPVAASLDIFFHDGRPSTSTQELEFLLILFFFFPIVPCHFSGWVVGRGAPRRLRLPIDHPWGGFFPLSDLLRSLRALLLFFIFYFCFIFSVLCCHV